VAKTEKNKIKEQIETVQVQRLKVKYDIEKEGLAADKFNLEKAKIATKIAQQNVKTEGVKLQQAITNTSLAEVGLGKLQDKLSYEKADRILSQQEMAAKLQLKAINVAALREDIRHQAVMTGANASKIQGADGKLFNNREQKQTQSAGSLSGSNDNSRSWGSSGGSGESKGFWGGGGNWGGDDR